MAQDHTDIVEALKRVYERTTSDPAAADEFLANPTGMVEAELGSSLPAGMSFQAVRDAATDHVMMVPVVPEGVELPQEALEFVSGGTGGGQGKSRNDKGQTCMSSKKPHSH